MNDLGTSEIRSEKMLFIDYLVACAPRAYICLEVIPTSLQPPVAAEDQAKRSLTLSLRIK
jgi:hypothetical protein